MGLMSGLENKYKALQYLAEQTEKVIDYQWEIRHHSQMHAAYEKYLQG